MSYYTVYEYTGGVDVLAVLRFPASADGDTSEAEAEVARFLDDYDIKDMGDSVWLNEYTVTMPADDPESIEIRIDVSESRIHGSSFEGYEKEAQDAGDGWVDAIETWFGERVRSTSVYTWDPDEDSYEDEDRAYAEYRDARMEEDR